MKNVLRFSVNPVLRPNQQFLWERCGTFNPSAYFDGKNYHVTYRALSVPQIYKYQSMQVSSIGYAKSPDAKTFENHLQLIKPEFDYEKYGCEDPRITFLDGTYYIFYTALSDFPFTPNGIKLAVCKTTDFKKLEKHPVTPFNSKAMGLFPEKINGKFAAVLTAHTDLPPAKICLALFEKESDMWSQNYWKRWYAHLDEHVIPLLRSATDQVEVGAQPVKTDQGWLLVFSYIINYYNPNRRFTVEAVLLDLDNPSKIIARTNQPLLVAETEYERNGNIKNVVFPSGACIKDDTLEIFYGAADTTGCIAKVPVKNLFEMLSPIVPTTSFASSKPGKSIVERFAGNPIIKPVPELFWEARATFNPAALRINDKTYIFYRAMSTDNTSTIGLAQTSNGFTIEKRNQAPVYIPRTDFEKKMITNGNSGCEDPRITRLEDKLYLCYTAFNGNGPPRVALTSISLENFLKQNWNWETPRLISPPGVDDKDACILPKKINGKYILFHRIGLSIWIDYVDSLQFGDDEFIAGKILINPRKNSWDNVKVGISAPPIQTEKGWLLFYHAVSNPGSIYKVGALLLDRENPSKVLFRTDAPLFQPEEPYEKEGQVGNVVFPCGAILSDQFVYLYYGAADTVVGVARIRLEKLLTVLIGR